MNSRHRQIYYLAALLFLAAGCVVVGERRATTITRSWPAAAIRRIDLSEVDGSVDVTAAATDQIALVAKVRSRGTVSDPKKENQGFFETRLDGDTLQIGHRRHVRIHFFGSSDVSVDYELRVPMTVALELRTVNGRIVTRGVDAQLEAATVNGALDLETSGANELSANTINGRLRARFTSDFQGARLKTVNGSVEAVLPESASFACDLSQVNGDFEASFPLSIHSNPGRRRVSGEVNGGRYDLRITTVNGDIRLENGPAAAIAPLPPAAPASTAPPAIPGLPAAPAAPASPAPPVAPNPTTR